MAVETWQKEKDEERKRDAVSCDRLMQMAKDEIAKENNYLNLVKAGKLKSKDRLEVLEKIALYEREGMVCGGRIEVLLEET